MWMSDVHSIGGYTFAAGLFVLGLVGWQVFVALVVGIVIVYFAHEPDGVAGQRDRRARSRSSPASRFGVFGANLPALIRAVIAIAWYGIQTYLASVAVVVLALSIWPGLGRGPRAASSGSRRARLDRFLGDVGAAAAGHPPRHGDRAAGSRTGRARRSGS